MPSACWNHGVGSRSPFTPSKGYFHSAEALRMPKPLEPWAHMPLCNPQISLYTPLIVVIFTPSTLPLVTLFTSANPRPPTVPWDRTLLRPAQHHISSQQRNHRPQSNHIHPHSTGLRRLRSRINSRSRGSLRGGIAFSAAESSDFEAV